MFSRVFSLTLLTVLIGCKGCKDKGDETAVNLDDTGDSSAEVDNDGDGVLADEDCDDDDATVGAGTTWYQDGDGDGYGDDGATTVACEQPAGTSRYGGDCDDADPAYNPAADEACDDPTDYNCDGSVGYEDRDGDDVPACEDCDDGNPDASPYEAEVCDGVDNDCDGSIDEEAADSGAWYTDADGDGYGVDGTGVISCDQPSGTAGAAGDCDDSNPDYNPGATEEDCLDPNDYNCDGSVGYADADGDGTPACEDCDDADVSRNPSADELCDGVDNDCDGETDEDSAVDASTWYTDADADGYGDASATTLACAQPDGTSAYDTDCDDSDPAYNPGAVESDCEDPNDYNCDGSVGYTDADGDGYAACAECDDADASENPGAVELCDGDDDDCDGEIDEDDAYDASSWYSDADSDGYGDPTSSITACSAPDGFVADATDCDNLNATVYPDAPELCDALDNDCDGDVDEDASEAVEWYADADGDGYGDADVSVTSCDPGPGYALDSTDCDDSDNVEYPGADELCDGDDDDCDGLVDESDAVDADTWYADGDADGYGDDDVSVTACDEPAGYSGYGGDCDDTDADYNPGATEDDCADPNDYNCDGSTGFVDEDGDGYAACDECDDSESDINPGADELCDGVDNDCDGDIDESGAGGATTWYTDGDGDGYGDPASAVEACDPPAGTVANSSDCDDDDADVHPGGAEYCDGVDNDCDGVVDEDSAFDASTWYADADSDGYGDPDSATDACSAPAGYVADDSDCDDTDASASPAGVEVCDDVDNDCDGLVDNDATDASTWYYDGDGDTYGDASVVTLACDRPARNRARSGDCDDTNASINPAATEVCDGVDNDCDGSVDEAGASGTVTWHADEDGDGYGDPSVEVEACDAPAGYVDDEDDCDDSDGLVNPDATEVCDGVDNDCDGRVDVGASDATTWYTDADGDGYGDTSSSTEACDAPAGTVHDDTDCDDSDDESYPGADEVCDDADNDCDGDVDEDAVDATSWYTDEDGDGYGDDSTEVVACEPPAGTVAESGDCDDGDTGFNPGIEDLCDGVDENCDGVIDDGVVAGRFLMSADTTAGAILDINPDDASATVVSSLATSPNIPSVAVAPDGTAYIHASGGLYTFDACTGTATLIGASGRSTVCGISFDGDGNLYGLDRTTRSLIKFDLSTGATTTVGSLGFSITVCGMAYDCTNDRLMGVDGSTNSLFQLDKTTGLASGFVPTGITFSSAGLEYDPRTQSFLASTSTSLYDVDYATGTSTLIGTVSPSSNVDDLAFYPECP